MIHKLYAAINIHSRPIMHGRYIYVAQKSSRIVGSKIISLFWNSIRQPVFNCFARPPDYVMSIRTIENIKISKGQMKFG